MAANNNRERFVLVAPAGLKDDTTPSVEAMIERGYDCYSISDDLFWDMYDSDLFDPLLEHYDSLIDEGEYGYYDSDLGFIAEAAKRMADSFPLFCKCAEMAYERDSSLTLIF